MESGAIAAGVNRDQMETHSLKPKPKLNNRQRAKLHFHQHVEAVEQKPVTDRHWPLLPACQHNKDTRCEFTDSCRSADSVRPPCSKLL